MSYDPEEDDDTCPKCGSDDCEWVNCSQCFGDGEFDLHDDDPVNYAEGEEYERCEECGGRGGWIECRGCIAKANEAAARRA